MTYVHKNNRGLSLIEVMITTGILTIAGLAMFQIFFESVKNGNYVEFRSKKNEISTSIIGQFLNNPDNCECLFEGSTPFPVAGVPLLTGTSPTAIGPFNKPSTTSCAGATIAYDIVNNTDVDHVRSTKIEMRDIQNVSGNYFGKLYLELESTRKVTGPSVLKISIPVAVKTQPAGGNVAFVNCSSAVSATGLSYIELPSVPTAVCHFSTLTPVIPITPCPTGFTENIQADSTWRTYNLASFGVPTTAKYVHLKILTAENYIYLKKIGDPAPPSMSNLVTYSNNGDITITNVKANIIGTNGLIMVMVSPTDLPTFGVSIQIVAYEE